MRKNVTKLLRAKVDELYPHNPNFQQEKVRKSTYRKLKRLWNKTPRSERKKTIREYPNQENAK